MKAQRPKDDTRARARGTHAILLSIALALAATPLAAGEKPTTTLTLSGTLGNGGWYRSDVTAVISCSDPTASRLWSIDGNNFHAYTGPVSVSQEGRRTFHALCMNALREVGSASQEFGIDKTSPEARAAIPFAVAGGGKFHVTITVSDPTAGLDGILTIEEGVGGYAHPRVWVPGALKWTVIHAAPASGSSLTVTLERAASTTGTYCYRVSASDVAGNRLVEALPRPSAEGALVEYGCVIYAPTP